MSATQHSATAATASTAAMAATASTTATAATAARRARQTNCSDEEHRGVSAARVRVLALRRPKPQCLTEEGGALVVNTTSTSKESWSRGLSPFFLGPVQLYGGHNARNVENAWQYCKVYAEFANASGAPTASYWEWAEAGWNAEKAKRFPMGRGMAPLYSLWDGGQRLGYIEARKRIYAPLYAEAVRRSDAFQRLQRMYEAAVHQNKPLVLLDFDGWDHVGQRFSLREVIEQPKPKMGHAFVLAGLLENDLFWLPPSQ